MRKLSKNKKIVVGFDSSGELMILFDKKLNQPLKTSKSSVYNWHKSDGHTSIFLYLQPQDRYEWRYR